MYTLEPAREADIPRCGEILDEGRAFQRAQGFVQWTEDYPNAGTVRQDIRDQKGYVIRSGGDIAAYLCIDLARSHIRGDAKSQQGITTARPPMTLSGCLLIRVLDGSGVSTQ